MRGLQRPPPRADGDSPQSVRTGTADLVTFIWDGDDLLNERIEGVHAARYAVLDGEVLSEKRGASRYRFVPDPLGSVRALLDTSGTIVATRDYWPYGEVAAESGGMTSLQFVGALGYFTGAVNRICLPARYYRPDLGRWQTRDPIGFAGGDWNLYAYARNSPCLLTDPSGRSIFVCTVFFSNGLLSHQFISTNRCGSFGFYGFTGGNPCAGRCEIDDLHLLCPKPPQYVWVIECTAALGCVRVKRKVCMPGVGANPNVRCEQVGGDNDERERALCECMRQSCSRPPFYVLPGFCCTNWVAEMLDCSWAALAMPAETGQLVIT